MNEIWELVPWFGAMVLLIACSAFFSASEAALFYLRPAARRALRKGSPPEKAAAKLLDDPDRLLSAVLFWNLVVNITYFAISSICAIRIEQMASFGGSYAAGFALVTLLTIIFCSEMVPKTVAVLNPRKMARLVSIPLAVAVRVADPIMPVLQMVNLVSQRVVWPGFQTEDYLEIADLERAIVLSGADANLIKQEQTVLQNVVQLSDIRVDEWMRPRTQLTVMRPPAKLKDLNGAMPPGGYILITEPESEEIEKAIHVDQLLELPSHEDLSRHAEQVIYLPWNATVADALEKMSKKDYDVTAVVNEYGDTIGVLTVHDILESVFAYSPSRSQRLFDQAPMEKLDDNRWRISGMMSLKRLAKKLDVTYPETHSVTVAGIIQEQLQAVAKKNDTCRWGPFHFRVVQAPKRANMVVEVKLEQNGETN